MQVYEFIESQLSEHLKPTFLEIVDESHQHNVTPGAQSHFKVTVVTDAFIGQRLIGRHRQVNGLLADALAGPVHALALHTYTPEEWTARGEQAFASPACRGGSKAG